MADDRTANVVLTADTSNYSQQMLAAQTSTNQTVTAVTKLVDAMDRLAKNTGRRLEIISATSVATVTAAGIAAGRLESQLGTLQATAAITGRSMKTMNETVDGLRRNLPVSTEQVIGLTQALQKLGANPQNIEKLAETFIKLGAATGEDIASLATGMVGLQRAMGTTEGSTTKFANSVAGLSANLGVSATGILQFSQSLAPIARTVGMTQTEVMGLSAAFLKSGQDGYAAANATVKMITDISRATRYGSSDLAMYANLVGKTTDEFTKMGSTDQLTALFSAINKAGPDAIKVLERMGLDGPRALKSIQGLAQSGQLERSVAEATRAFNGDDLETGSKAAMDGLNDSLTKLRNNLTSIAQEFGRTFLPALTAVTEGFARMAGTVRSVMQPMSAAIAGIGTLAGVGGVGAGIMGMALSNMSTLGALAGAYFLSRSALGAGFRARREESNPRYQARGVYRPAIDRLNAGEGSRFQQGMFRAGRMRYDLSPTHLRDSITSRMPPAAPGTGMGARLVMLGSLGAQGILGAARSTIDPLRWTAATNIVERSRLSRMEMADQWRAVRSPTANNQASYGRALGGLITSTGRFSASLISATAGLTRLTVATGARGMGNLALRSGSAMLGAVGGVAGLAVGGLIAGGMYVGGKRADSASFRENLATDEGAESSANRYASSLGLAGSAAMSFAETLRKAESNIPVDDATARQVRESDAAAAKVAGRELTDRNLAGLTESQAAAYAGTMLGGPTDPRAIQALKLDLIQQFNPETAQRILDQGGSSNFRPGDIIGQDQSRIFARFFGATDEFQSQTRAAASTVGVQQAQLYGQFGSEESNKYTAAAVNQILDKFATNDSTGAQVALTQALEEILGGEKLGITTGEQARLHRATSPTARTDIFHELIGDTETGRNFLNSLTGESTYARDYTAPRPQDVGLSELDSRIQATQAGSYARSSNLVQTALSQEDNANANLQAATTMAADMVKVTGSTNGANDALQALKAAIGDTTNPLYQLANSAQSATSRLSGYAAAYQTGPENAARSRTALASAYSSPDAPDREERVIAAEDAYEQQRAGLFNQFKNITRTYREFNISRSRQESDFNLSRSRQNYQFGLQQSRSQADYDLSRRRGEADYQQQRARGQFDYDLQRQQSQEDFDLSRRRAESDYQHQIQMMARQTAQSISDIYSRIITQPTWDAQNLLTNAQDQLGAMERQQADLSTLRGMGVSGDVIEMMGLNDFNNQQQLARFVADLASDPSLVQAFNENIAGKLDMGKAFSTDQDSDAFKEMQRSFNLSMDRSSEDYERMVTRGADAYNRGLERMAEDYGKMVGRGADDYAKMLSRQNQDYATSVSQTVTDWNTQMGRAKEDLNRNFEEVTGTFAELQESALGALTGTAKSQMSALATALGETRETIKGQIEGAKEDISTGLTPLFGTKEAAQAALNAAVMINGGRPTTGGGGGVMQKMAEGGTVPGFSPHARADNIPAMLTAGEYVHPVATTEYYGKDVMDAMRSKKIPKWAVQGFADGGLVEFGRMLQGKGFRVGEHPAFGGVAPVHMKNSLHYSGRAIDVNWAAGTSLAEQKAIDAIVPLAKQYGLSTIWRAPGHFGHAHFDTGNYSKIGSSTIIGNNPSVGATSAAVNIDVGAIMRGKNVQGVEKSLTNMVHGGAYLPGTFTQSLGHLLSKVAKVEPDAGSWHGNGGIFSSAQRIGVGERGPEALLPLNARGADFLAETMNRFSPGERAVRGGQVVETKTVTYNQTFDQSTQISGPITVQAQDPNEMYRKLEEKKRMDRLRRPR